MIDAILEEIEKENEVGIYVDDNKMTQDVLDIIKEEKYVATIEVSWLYEEYEDVDDIPDDFDDKVTASWIFNGSKITSTDYEIDLGIKRNAGENIETIKKLVSDVTKAIFLDFAHSGKLPEGTQVKVYVGDKFDDKTMLKLSLFNPETGKLELTATKIEVVDGYVVFDLEHCSEYVLEIDDTVEATNNAQTSSLNYKAYAMISVLSLLIIGISLIKLKEQA